MEKTLKTLKLIQETDFTVKVGNGYINNKRLSKGKNPIKRSIG